MIENRKPYPKDLTDEEWSHLRLLLPKAQGKDRRSSQQQRELGNAMNYVLRTGCQWRDLPHDFPKNATVLVMTRLMLKRLHPR